MKPMGPKDEAQPNVNPTLDAGFDALGGLAAAVDADAAAVLNPAMADQSTNAGGLPQGPDYAKGAAGLVDLASAMIGGYCPEAAWPDERRALMAASIAPVLEKYGWDIEGNTPCELVALAVCGPALYQSAKLVALKIAQDRAELARQVRGLADPNTIRGARRDAPGPMETGEWDAAGGPPAASQASANVDAGAALAEAVITAKIFPDM